METNTNDEQELNKVNAKLSENKLTGSGPAKVAHIPTEIKKDAHKKKYHSSAMYAGSLLHSAVNYVKPYHPEIR